MSARRSRLAACLLVVLAGASAAGAGETLYNGIVLPDRWPPEAEHFSVAPMPVPYLEHRPAVVPIDVGRQLLVDDFLIEHTTLRRTYHRAEYHPASPVLRPDKPWETAAMAFSGGVWYDPADRRFKAWYQADKKKTLAYATSTDGINWEKPALDVEPGTNVVLRSDHDTSTVWLDQAERDPSRRYKLTTTPYLRKVQRSISGMRLFFSPDGIHWSDSGADMGWCLDRSTVFYNPFRRVWVFSIKWNLYGFDIEPDGTLRIAPGEEQSPAGRFRGYREHPDILAGIQWKSPQVPGKGSEKDFLNTFLVGSAVPWTSADFLDPLRNRPAAKGTLVNLRHQPELYNLDAVAYESILLGMFNIFHGNDDGTPTSHEHMNDVTLGYSRDGFHWYRPDRRAFLPVSSKRGDWNWTNTQSVGGCALVVGDRLHFYATGRNPDVTTTGLATLRRDGFASMDAGAEPGTLVTRPVTFGGTRLFVNAKVPAGELRAEILTQGGQPIAPFTRENSIPVRADATLAEVHWKGAEDLSALAGRPVRFRFWLRDGSLYAFWVSPDAHGSSRGYVAAGGPGFTGSTDTVGRGAGR